MENIKILFIEDEEVLASNVQKILEYSKYQVEHASNGIEALELVKKYEYDLILCDVQMPLMNGYEFYAAYRELGHDDTPFVFLTANAHYEDIRSAMNLGADDYLVKPVKRADLLKAIDIRLSKKIKLQTDISEKTKHFIEQIEKRDNTLRHIAQNQSHVIRAPLATMMAIISLVDTTNMDEENKMLISKLEPLAQKLDAVIRENVYSINSL